MTIEERKVFLESNELLLKRIYETRTDLTKLMTESISSIWVALLQKGIITPKEMDEIQEQVGKNIEEHWKELELDDKT